MEVAPCSEVASVNKSACIWFTRQGEKKCIFQQSDFKRRNEWQGLKILSWRNKTLLANQQSTYRSKTLE
jgi:hypothetical protein